MYISFIQINSRAYNYLFPSLLQNKTQPRSNLCKKANYCMEFLGAKDKELRIPISLSGLWKIKTSVLQNIIYASSPFYILIYNQVGTNHQRFVLTNKCSANLSFVLTNKWVKLKTVTPLEDPLRLAYHPVWFLQEHALNMTMSITTGKNHSSSKIRKGYSVI
jgi:hypothetical protein